MVSALKGLSVIRERQAMRHGEFSAEVGWPGQCGLARMETALAEGCTNPVRCSGWNTNSIGWGVGSGAGNCGHILGELGVLYLALFSLVLFPCSASHPCELSHSAPYVLLPQWLSLEASCSQVECP